MNYRPRVFVREYARCRCGRWEQIRSHYATLAAVLEHREIVQ